VLRKTCHSVTIHTNATWTDSGMNPGPEMRSHWLTALTVAST